MKNNIEEVLKRIKCAIHDNIKDLDIVAALYGSYDLASELKKYKDLESQGKLARLPCVVGNFALFSNGDILPVTYITIANKNGDIVVGCQNGAKISMYLHYGYWCKGFFETEEEAEKAFIKLTGRCYDKKRSNRES